jgi:hypothetical protein
MTADSRSDSSAPTALASLRRFVRPRATRERCDLCSVELAEEHAHLVESASRRLCCACDACAVLFDSQAAGTYRRVPRDVWLLDDFRLSDVQWAGLQLPIELAFFLHSTPAKRVVALYPSPGGATEALPPPEAWEALADDNPVLRRLEPDVEALLVNRLAAAPEYYRVGIDQCYRLVGVVRTHWRGLSGGTAVWQEIARFFATLKERAAPAGGTAHA